MSIFKEIRELVTPSNSRPKPTKYYILPDGYAAAQFVIDDDVFYSIYIGLNHWENKSELPEGSKVQNRERALLAAKALDESLRERLLAAISTLNGKGRGFSVKIKGAVKYDVEYATEEEFLAQKRELLLQGYKVDDRITYTLNVKEALKTVGHRDITDGEWKQSCEYAKREEGKMLLLEKVCNDIMHDDISTEPEERL
ncbi:MAG: hypothetical protein HUK08_00130 [Bacteroidaceae bacterium]|nr:hypothetical protein [Bacteroidaceae bacterium]